MTRVQFTKMMVKLLEQMIDDKYKPIVDFVKRSEEEQNRLFKIGRSQDENGSWYVTGKTVTKCDGVTYISKHQFGKAVDIYFINDMGQMIDWNDIKEVAYKYHDFWYKLGGQKLITGDLGHFEV